MYKKYKELISDITEILKENKDELSRWSEFCFWKIAGKIIDKIEENNVIVFLKRKIIYKIWKNFPIKNIAKNI